MDNYHIAKSIAAVDITPLGVDKNFWVKEACQRLRISLSQVLCIGDALNDIPMLEAAGFSGCPSNAVGEVKRIVDFVASSDSTRGMLEILKHFSPFFTQYPKIL
jgi:hydroxymethylpyrimidine pyrophosphatase-like HAD family hydrolase